MYQQDFLQSFKNFEQEKVIPFPVQYKSKKPIKNQPWKKLQFSCPEMEELIKIDLYNLAVKSGLESENLVILDFDDPSILSHLRDVNPKLEYIFKNTIVTLSPGRKPHGFHVYIKTPYPVQSSKIPNLNIDIKAQGGYVLTFPSIHPNGGQYVQLEGNDSILSLDHEDIEELSQIIEFKPYQERKLTPTIEKSGISPDFIWSYLPPFYKDILRGRISPKYQYEDGKPDRSRADQALLTLLVKDGFSSKDSLNLFLKYAHSEHKIRSRDPRKYIEKSFSNAENYYLKNRSEFDLKLDFAWWNCELLFSGRSKSSLILIIRSMIWVSKYSYKTLIGISEREIILLTGLSSRTVVKSKIKLKEMGFIQRVKKNYYSKSSEYKLTNDFFDSLLKDKLQTIPHLHSVSLNSSVTDSLPFDELEKDKCKSTPHLHSVILMDSVSIPRIDLYSLIKVTNDSYSYLTLNKNSIDLIDYINTNIGIELTLKEIISNTDIQDRRTLNKKLSLVSQVIEVTETSIPGKTRPEKGFIFKEEITSEKLEILSELTGSKGSHQKRTKRVERERKNYKEYINTLIQEKKEKSS